jgi:hypothetical protein
MVGHEGIYIPIYRVQVRGGEDGGRGIDEGLRASGCVLARSRSSARGDAPADSIVPLVHLGGQIMIDAGTGLDRRPLAVVLLPGKFKPQPPSKFEDNLFTYAPPQILALFTFGLFAPGSLFAYWIFNSHVIAAVLGSLVWFPVLWLFLLEVHTMGRVRFWLSAPVMFVGHVVIALWFACLL